ncbi:MAG: hypothetical protein GEV13_11825 [Rhodospirillales bacterium]|nr:hypothetical protein [Rhodospirillales bacterium]
MKSTLIEELSKLSIEERRALIDDLWDSIESDLDASPVSDNVGKLHDKRAGALARDLSQKKFTLEEMVARSGRRA